MKCYSCGKELSDGAKFCRFCGAKMIPAAVRGESAAEGMSSAAEEEKEPAAAEEAAEPEPAHISPRGAGRFCTSCGAPVPAGYKFCTACGSPLRQAAGTQEPAAEEPVPASEKTQEPAAPAARVCANCGAEIPEGYKFCISCGTPAPGTQGAGPAKTPGRPGGGESSAPGSRGGTEPPVRGTPGEDEGGRKKGVSPVILIIIAAVVILAVIAAVFVLMRGDDDGAAESAATEEAAEETEEETADEPAAEEDEAPADESEEEQGAAEEEAEEETAEEEESSEDEAEEEETEEEDSGIDPEVEAAVEDILAKIDEIDGAAESEDAGTYLSEEDSCTVILLDEEIIRISVDETDSSGFARHYYYEDGEVLAVFYLSDSSSQEYYFEDGALIRWVEQEDLTLADGAVTHDKEDSAEYEELGTVIPEEAAELLEEMEEAIAPQSEYILEGSDSRYIDESELEDLSEEELRLARNEIYARNGRKFNDETLTEYFSQFDWYEPTIDPDDFTDSMLNEYELANVQTIVAYEEKMGYR